MLRFRHSITNPVLAGFLDVRASVTSNATNDILRDDSEALLRSTVRFDECDANDRIRFQRGGRVERCDGVQRTVGSRNAFPQFGTSGENETSKPSKAARILSSRTQAHSGAIVRSLASDGRRRQENTLQINSATKQPSKLLSKCQNATTPATNQSIILFPYIAVISFSSFLS